MNVVVAIEHHFLQVGDEVHTQLAFGYAYWREYLDVFSGVIVLARVGTADRAPEGWFRADGPHVRFVAVPDYTGPRQFFLSLPGVLRAARAAARIGDRFILRSGNVCTSLWIWLKLLGRPYAREVQGKVGESISHGLSKRYRLTAGLMAGLSDWLARLQVRGAFAASYVSRDCRQHYPTHGGREFEFSSVRLSEDLVGRARTLAEFDGPLRILSVGRMETDKGHAYLLEALRQLRQRGIAFEARFVGPGTLVDLYRAQVEQSGMADAVQVLGGIEYGAPLFAQLDWAHLFVLPSLTEGLPRALVEAMARGLPALGTRAGGIPELLSDAAIVATRDAEAIAEKIALWSADRLVLVDASRRNFEFATENYGQAVMAQRKHAFWRVVREHGGRA